MAAARQKVSKAGTLDEVVISARRGGILTSQATVSNINNELTFRGAQARQKEAGVDLLDFAGRVGGAIAELACEAKAHARGRIHRHATVGSAKVAARRHSQNRHLDAIVQEKAGDDDRRASFAESKESGSEQGEPKELSDEFWDPGDQKQSADPDRSGHQVRDAFMLFKRLQGHPEHKACRSLYLAEIEMRAVAFACSESEALVRSEAAAVSTSASMGANVTWPLPGLNADFADFVEILAAYFGRFGHVGGCYTDMKPYLSLLDESRADMLMQKLEQQQASGVGLAENAGQGQEATECHALQRRLTLARLRHGLRILEGAPPEELAEEAMQQFVCEAKVSVFGKISGADSQEFISGGALTAAALDEIRQLKHPPVAVRRTLEALHLLLHADRHRSGLPRGGVKWESVMRTVCRDDLALRMQNFDISQLQRSPSLARDLRQSYFGEADCCEEALSLERVRYASKTAAALFSWAARTIEEATAEAPGQGEQSEEHTPGLADLLEVTAKEFFPDVVLDASEDGELLSVGVWATCPGGH
ncbi:unnamed protein product, partial [Polarella glacialis]